MYMVRNIKIDEGAKTTKEVVMGSRERRANRGMKRRKISVRGMANDETGDGKQKQK